MCSGMDIGNTVMQKTLWCDTIYIGRTFPSLKFIVSTCFCWVMVYWGRVQRVQESFSIHHEDYIFQPSRLRICEHNASGGTGLGKPTRHNLRFIHWSGVVCENCTQHCSRVCVHGGYQDTWWKFIKIDVWRCFSLLQSFKGGANGFPQSMAMLWDMGSTFYTKWA